MTWTSVTPEEALLCQQMALWIATARAAGYGGPAWLPSAADIHKSALFERIRSGKSPLPFPPPIGLACPWYALVEDPGPHRVGREGPWAPRFGPDGFLAADEVSVVQNLYRVVERRADALVLRDAAHGEGSPWLFRLWLEDGWWLMRNMEFAAP
jgi:hypothetical protein